MTALVAALTHPAQAPASLCSSSLAIDLRRQAITSMPDRPLRLAAAQCLHAASPCKLGMRTSWFPPCQPADGAMMHFFQVVSYVSPLGYKMACE